MRLNAAQYYIPILMIMIIGFIFLIPAQAYSADDIKKTCADAKKYNPDKELPAFCQDYREGLNEGDDPDASPAKDILDGVVNLLSFAAGAVAVILVIFGGFKYTKSAGDSSKITDAKNTIIYALVGIIVVLLARELILFVLNRLL